MRRSVLWASFAVLSGLVVLPSDAVAQVASGTTPVVLVPATPPPTITTATAVVTLLSLVLGVVTQMVQTGMFLKWAAPKSWLPPLTIAMTLLGGIVSYLGSQSPLVLNAPTILYAVLAGIVSLMTGAAPGLAVHAHVVVPETVRAIRVKRLAAASGRLAAARGFTRMKLVQGLAIAGIVGACLAPVVRHSTTIERPAMVVEGCGFFNSSGGAQTVQSASAIGACIILQVMGGVTNVDSVIQACGNVLSSQLVSEIDAIIAFYTQPPAVDGGAPALDAGPVVAAAAAPMLCGAGTPPVANAPACMPLSVITMLKYLRVAAAARASDAGAAASAH